VVARELYISAKCTDRGINAIDGTNTNMFYLKIGPVPPYSPNPNTDWTNEEYCERLKTYTEEVIATKGWGIHMFHDWSRSGELNSGYQITETALRYYLSEITTSLASRLWIAPQGTVARYYLERQGSAIQTSLVTDNVIVLNVVFEGDKTIFNEPLTLITIIPEHWLSEQLIVMQGRTHIDYIADAYTIEPIGSIIVSGDIGPDATGTYYKLPSQYNGEPVYKALGKDYYICSTGSQYFLSDGLDNDGYDFWSSGGGTSPIGTYYVEDANATGTPIAVAVPHNEPCLLYEVLPGGGVINIVSAPIPGDINGDGDMDMVDLASLGSPSPLAEERGSHLLEGVKE